MSNNNTIAIALAALLVGGVATAGYMNSRSNKTDEALPTTPAAPQAGQTAGSTEPLPPDTAIPASGKLEYAEVLNVQPVTASEPLYATVLKSTPINETSTSNTPREVCEDVVVQERLPEKDGNVGGTVAGALIGGLVGNQVGGGNGKKLATVAGAVAGGYVGNKVDKNHVGGKVVERTERQCHTVNNTSSTSHTVGYDVSYRKPDGSTGSMRMDKKPGSKIAMGDGSKTIGYDVTYRLNGQDRTVRMDQKPGTQLPVIDGQVVTQTAEVDTGATRQ
jgi:uncharacterized protein YcfJ